MLIFVFVFLVACVGEVKSEECLSYEPAKVALTGTIMRKTFPGPPNYESIENGDEPETYWILKLKKPVCVKGNPDDELNSETEKNVKNIHLVIDGEKYARYRHLVSKNVVAQGTLFHAHTAHHRTKVLLMIISIKPVEERD